MCWQLHAIGTCGDFPPTSSTTTTTHVENLCWRIALGEANDQASDVKRLYSIITHRDPLLAGVYIHRFRRVFEFDEVDFSLSLLSVFIFSFSSSFRYAVLV